MLVGLVERSAGGSSVTPGTLPSIITDPRLAQPLLCSSKLSVGMSSTPVASYEGCPDSTSLVTGKTAFDGWMLSGRPSSVICTFMPPPLQPRSSHHHTSVLELNVSQVEILNLLPEVGLSPSTPSQKGPSVCSPKPFTSTRCPFGPAPRYLRTPP